VLKFNRLNSANRLADHLPDSLPVPFPYGPAPMTRAFNRAICPLNKNAEQPRQDLAAGQIACAAENHQDKGVDRNDA